MDKVIHQLKRYFGRFEYGVYREAIEPTESGAVWSVNQTPKAISYLKAMNAQGRHIFVRPTFEREPYFMMCDDLDKKGLERHHKHLGDYKPGRLVVESSPDNYQVWIRSDRALSVEEKTHWLKKMDSDPGASPRHRWGRAPGFRNRKEKYADNGRYPLAKLIWVDWKDRAIVPKADLPQPKIEHQPRPAAPKTFSRKTRSLPTRTDFERGDNSRTDFAYALALMRRGVNREEIEQRIRSERSDWRHHQGARSMTDYFKRTLDRAQTIIDRSPATPRKNGWRQQGRGQGQLQEPDGCRQCLSQGMGL